MGGRGIPGPGGRRRAVVLEVTIGLVAVAVGLAALLAVRGLRTTAAPAPVFPPGPTARPTSAHVFQTDAQVLFDSGSAVIRPAAESVLAKIAEEIRTKYPTGVVRVEGYTDDIGTEDFNIGLAQSRADSVAFWLSTTGGIARSRLQTVPYGEADQAQPNDTVEHRQANRRVVIRVAA